MLLAMIRAGEALSQRNEYAQEASLRADFIEVGRG